MARNIVRENGVQTIEYDDSVPRKIDRKDSKPKLVTQARIAELARHIAEEGWTYRESVDWVAEHYGLQKTQCERYYYQACHSLLPEDPG